MPLSKRGASLRSTASAMLAKAAPDTSKEFMNGKEINP